MIRQNFSVAAIMWDGIFYTASMKLKCVREWRDHEKHFVISNFPLAREREFRLVIKNSACDCPSQLLYFRLSHLSDLFGVPFFFLPLQFFLFFLIQIAQLPSFWAILWPQTHLRLDAKRSRPDDGRIREKKIMIVTFHCLQYSLTHHKSFSNPFIRHLKHESQFQKEIKDKKSMLGAFEWISWNCYLTFLSFQLSL